MEKNLSKTEKTLTPYLQLLDKLDTKKSVLIQTHDFPDHDAIGAAYALSVLLTKKRFNCSITYGGLLQSIRVASQLFIG